MALGLGCASVPWTLDPVSLSARMNESAPIANYHWLAPSRATLRLFPTPVLDVYGLKLSDVSGKVAFEASAVAFGLSAPSLAFGHYVFLRARLKNPTAEIDLDALAPALPKLLKSPPTQMVIARGGRLRIVSRRLGLNEELSPIDGAIAWRGGNQPVSATFGGVWRGQWASVDAELTSPADFLAGLPSETHLNASAAGATATIQGKAQLGDKPGLAASVTAKADSLAATAAWLGFDASELTDSEAHVSGKVSVSPEMLSLDDGSLGYRNQEFEGSAALLRGAGGWTATATLAAETLDLTDLIGPPPKLFTSQGEWSQTPIRITAPPFDIDFRLSAANLAWGGANFADAALVLQRQGDKASLKIIEAGYAGGGLNGEIDVENCATHCQARASLTLANADVSALARPASRMALSGRVSGELDISAFGDAPASLIQTARGELRIDAVDGVIKGVNFEEALRRSQRRSLELARDLGVGKTAFRNFGAKLTIGDGEAQIDSARLGGPGISIIGAGRIDFANQAWATTVEARQADGQGEPSEGGATMSLELNGPWRSPKLALSPRSD